MRDRQYCTSLALFIVAAMATLAVLMLALVWLVWVGVAALMVILGGLLVWFYWGARQDRPGSDRGRPIDGTRND